MKPANLGSSVGVSKARDRAELDAAVDLALSFDEWILVEEAIAGREIEVAVLGDDPPTASVPGEIVPGDDFYSYADKYEDDDARAARARAAQRRAARRGPAPRVPGVRGVPVRGDGAGRPLPREDAETGQGFLVNEVNTIPGFTPISMYPRLWEASGVPYSELLDRLIDLALDRHARRAAAPAAARRRPPFGVRRAAAPTDAKR